MKHTHTKNIKQKFIKKIYKIKVNSSECNRLGIKIEDSKHYKMKSLTESP